MDTHNKNLTLAAKVSNILLRTAALYCLFLAGYAVYHYGWNVDKHQPNIVTIVFSCILPAVLGVALLFLQRLPAARRVKLAMALTSTAISVYAVEIVLLSMTLWLSLPSVRGQRDLQERVKAAEASGKQFDVRSRIEVLRDLRQQGVNAYPTIPPLDFALGSHISAVEGQAKPHLSSVIRINGAEVLPLNGISRKVSVMCNEGGEYTIYESDRHGFHNPETLWASKQIDVVSLGDSFTHGYCVSSEKNFVSLIRDHYPSTVNLGIAGHGPLQMLATLTEYAAPLKPKIVLWFYFEGNDLRDLRVERHYPLLMRYLKSTFSQGLIAKRNDLDAALKAYFENRLLVEQQKPLEGMAELLGGTHQRVDIAKQILKLSNLRQKIGLTGDQVPKYQSVEAYGDVLGLFSQILLRADATVRAWGGQLYLVYLPEWERFGNPENVDRRREAVLEVVKALKLPVIDVYQAFRSHEDPLSLFPFRLNGHYNEAGHRLVAHDVLKSIKLN